MAARSLMAARALPRSKRDQILLTALRRPVVPSSTESAEILRRCVPSPQISLDLKPKQQRQAEISLTSSLDISNRRPSLYAQTILDIPENYSPTEEEDPGLSASSTLKKRRLKMNKHKYRKRRKRNRKKTKDT